MNKVNKKEFIDIYNEKIFPHLKAWEVIRKKQYILYIIVVILSVVGVFLYLLTFILPVIYPNDILREFFPYLASLCLFVPSALCLFASDIFKKFQIKLKDYCLPIITDAFSNIKWEKQKNVISEEDIQKSKFYTDNVYCIDDSFSGIYKDMEFKVEEITRAATTFINPYREIVIFFKTRKYVKSHTMLFSKKEIKNIKKYLNFSFAFLTLLWLICIFIVVLIKDPMGKIFFSFILFPFIFIVSICERLSISPAKNNVSNTINLEDVDFEKKFNVISQDPIESRIIATPSFMEKLLNLKIIFNTEDIKCAFFENKIMISVKTKKDFFEIGQINKTLLNPENYKNILLEINAIYEIIDYFKMDK